METKIPSDDELLLLEEMNKGIDDMENGRTTAHEDSMTILKRRYNDYVLQNS